MHKREKVILYNSKTVFFDMPLTLLAIGSILDSKKYEVIIIDGRLTNNVLNSVLPHLEDAVCFGASVITGAPISDALNLSAQVKKARPNLPVIWGDSDTSLFPLQTLYDKPFIGITIQGQGKNAYKELVSFYQNRIEGFCKELINRKLNISWAATMRAVKGKRLTNKDWDLCKKSGLRRLLIGVESGSQEMMDWKKKDVKLTEVFYCADKCKELDISVIFPFTLGFPDESDESVSETVKVAKKTKKTKHQV